MGGERTREGAKKGAEGHDNFLHKARVRVGRVTAAEDVDEGSKKVRKSGKEKCLDCFMEGERRGGGGWEEVEEEGGRRVGGGWEEVEEEGGRRVGGGERQGEVVAGERRSRY